MGNRSGTGAVAVSALVDITAVGYPTVEMVAGCGAVLIGANGNAGLYALGVPDAMVSAASSAVAAVGRSRYHQHSGQSGGTKQTAQQTALSSHNKNTPFSLAEKP